MQAISCFHHCTYSLWNLNGCGGFLSFFDIKNTMQLR
jgi:hypothetical protein